MMVLLRHKGALATSGYLLPSQRSCSRRFDRLLIGVVCPAACLVTVVSNAIAQEVQLVRLLASGLQSPCGEDCLEHHWE